MFQTSTDAPYIARHVGLKSGVPDSSIALTVNRLCGSGFQSIINGAQVSGNLHASLVCLYILLVSAFSLETYNLHVCTYS